MFARAERPTYTMHLYYRAHSAAIDPLRDTISTGSTVIRCAEKSLVASGWKYPSTFKRLMMFVTCKPRLAIILLGISPRKLKADMGCLITMISG